MVGMNALNIAEYTQTLGLQAKLASAQMARANAAIKNKALKALARLLRENTAALQTDNARDLERATAAGGTERGWQVERVGAEGGEAIFYLDVAEGADFWRALMKRDTYR